MMFQLPVNLETLKADKCKTRGTMRTYEYENYEYENYEHYEHYERTDQFPYAIWHKIGQQL